MAARRSRRGERGFTLIELMIVLVIVAVLMALAGPSLVDLLKQNRMQTGANGFRASLMLARSEALKHNQSVVICRKDPSSVGCGGVSGQWESGWLVYIDMDADSVADPNEVIRVQEAFKSGDTLRVTGSIFDDDVTYRNDGSASGSAVFVLCNSTGDQESAREIDIALTGRPRVNKSTTRNCASP